MTPDQFIETVYYNQTGFRIKGVKTPFPDLRKVVLYILNNFDNVSEEVEELLLDKETLKDLEGKMKRGQLSTTQVAPELLNFLKEYLIIISGAFGNEIWIKDDYNQISLLGLAHSQSIVEKTSLALLCDKLEQEKKALTNAYNDYRMGSEKPLNKRKWLAFNIENFLSDPTVADTMPELLSWGPLPEGEVSLRVLDQSLLDRALKEDTPTPYWNQVLCRISDPKAFMAWTWSLFSGVHETRQVCWIKGGGNDGKSTISNVFIQMLGSVACSFALSGHNQFTGSKFFRKRLVSVPDVKHERILENEFIFQVTGGDTIDIEFKGRDSFSQKVNSHFFMASNLSPIIDVYSKAYKSRLLYFKIEPVKKTEKESESFSDCTFFDSLISEMYPFLGRCKKVYEQKGINGNRIPVSERMAKDIETECKHPTLPIIEDFCRSTLEKSEGINLTVNELRSPFKKILRQYSMPPMTDKDIKMLENYLEVVWGVEKQGPVFLDLNFKDESDYEEA